MKSIREIYKIGKGPSSSHSMGPERAAKLFLSEHPEADAFRVTLYGSLAKTGKGHGTDRVLTETLAPIPVEILFDVDHSPSHPNTLELSAFRGDRQTGFMRVESIGGGDIRIEGRPEINPPEIYRENSFAEISAYCKAHNLRLSEYIEQNEGSEIWDFLFDVWSVMCRSIQEGLTRSGELPGGLHVERKAQ